MEIVQGRAEDPSTIGEDMSPTKITTTPGTTDTIPEHHSVPTFYDAWGCLDCSVIQSRPQLMLCGHCGSSVLFDIGAILSRHGGLP